MVAFPRVPWCRFGGEAVPVMQVSLFAKDQGIVDSQPIGARFNPLAASLSSFSNACTTNSAWCDMFKPLSFFSRQVWTIFAGPLCRHWPLVFWLGGTAMHFVGNVAHP
mmetsp:Transcript_21887/g.70873  ORF Transcript_21887/g.70873 Transcript_21887/m.70873 type:complete len:108 (+) Transcript_21887:274-597(+)